VPRGFDISATLLVRQLSPGDERLLLDCDWQQAGEVLDEVAERLRQQNTKSRTDLLAMAKTAHPDVVDALASLPEYDPFDPTA
jgi:hypothetical protein